MFSRRSSSPLQDAGSCAEQIALLRFIDDIMFETKLGDLGMILSFSGIDPDCRPDEVLNAFTRRYESAMRLFDDRFRVYSYIVKRSGATAPYRDRYLTLRPPRLFIAALKHSGSAPTPCMKFSSTWPCCTKASGHKRSYSVRSSAQPRMSRRKQPAHSKSCREPFVRFSL